MEALLETQEQAIAGRDVDGFVDSDDAFHRELFLACGKARAWSFIDHFSAQYKRLRYLSLQNYLDFGNVLDEHRAILSACRRRDSDNALRWLSRHLNKILGESEHLREKFPAYVKKSGVSRDSAAVGTTIPVQGA